MSTPRKKKKALKAEEITDSRSVIKRVILDLGHRQQKVDNEIAALDQKRKDIGEAIDLLDAAEDLIPS